MKTERPLIRGGKIRIGSRHRLRFQHRAHNMPSVNPDALRMIAGNREWIRSIGVCRALLRSPKTPLREALILLEKLSLTDIRAPAKSDHVKTPIQRAARKKVVHQEGGGSRPRFAA